MSTQTELAKLSVQAFAERFRREMIPLGNRFAYFSVLPLAEDDVKDYLEEPIAALPPAIRTSLGSVLVFLVPYLQRGEGKTTSEVVTFDKPAERNRAWAAHTGSRDESVMVLAIREREVADYHYSFYRSVARLTADRVSEADMDRFGQLLREELKNTVHGDVDEESWRQKAQLIRRQGEARRETKLFREYARQAFVDTLTLYLHGICCDIDVDTGPRQLPSRPLRKRLELLRELFPPPNGYAVFPEELNG